MRPSPILSWQGFAGFSANCTSPFAPCPCRPISLQFAIPHGTNRWRGAVWIGSNGVFQPRAPGAAGRAQLRASGYGVSEMVGDHLRWQVRVRGWHPFANKWKRGGVAPLSGWLADKYVRVCQSENRRETATMHRSQLCRDGQRRTGPDVGPVGHKTTWANTDLDIVLNRVSWWLHFRRLPSMSFSIPSTEPSTDH